MIRQIVIFGASGDLTSRFLIPTVARLANTGSLGNDLQITGTDRHDWTDEAYRRHIREKLPGPDTGSMDDDFMRRLTYRQGDVTKPEDVKAILSTLKEPVVLYLALPPTVLLSACHAIAAAGLPLGSRIVLEKPFGTDLQSTRRINEVLAETFPEPSIFRMDHFLGKQTIQNILGLRFGNRVFEPIWNGRHVERVEITWDETLTVEGRVGFYDSTGTLRDMIQNHLLQLLCLVGMEPPPTLGERDFRDYKVALLRAVRKLSPEEVRRYAFRARYGAGRIGNRKVPAFTDEPGVDRRRNTETFAQVTLWIDNWRWADVPFTLRSGKALAGERTEIRIVFKRVPHLAFFKSSPEHANVLRLELAPDRVVLGLNINGPGDPFILDHIDLAATLTAQEMPAYGRLLMDVFHGDSTLSIRADEAEESWRIVEPILEEWERHQDPLPEYPAGSNFLGETGSAAERR